MDQPVPVDPAQVAEPIETEETMPSFPDNEPGAAQPPAGRRIVVVDDNRDSAESLALLLEMHGHEVQIAFSGPAALELAHTFRPEIVLLDIGLPGMDGREVARALRAAQGDHPLLLVALTGYGQDEDRRLSREAGFDHHLVKPVDLQELVRVIARG
jgi:CheY-like chemotaxis protein